MSFRTGGPLRTADFVLHELRQAVALAARLTADVASRLAAGDAADDALESLAAHVRTAERCAGELGDRLPADDRAALAELGARVQAAATAGGDWLTAAAPELAATANTLRLRRAYRPPP